MCGSCSADRLQADDPGRGLLAGQWHDFFIAVAGAAAALSGLVFVALSINLARILAYSWLPGRALETITVLFEALILALMCLAPQQRQVLGT